MSEKRKRVKEFGVIAGRMESDMHNDLKDLSNARDAKSVIELLKERGALD